MEIETNALTCDLFDTANCVTDLINAGVVRNRSVLQSEGVEYISQINISTSTVGNLTCYIGNDVNNTYKIPFGPQISEPPSKMLNIYIYNN